MTPNTTVPANTEKPQLEKAMTSVFDLMGASREGAVGDHDALRQPQREEDLRDGLEPDLARQQRAEVRNEVRAQPRACAIERHSAHEQDGHDEKRQRHRVRGSLADGLRAPHAQPHDRPVEEQRERASTAPRPAPR